MTEPTTAPSATPLDLPAPTPDPLAEIKAKLTETEKEKFFKAFLADKPYIADESLFKGKVLVKFCTLNIKQNDAILLQMQFDRETGVAKNNDKYIIQVIEYRLAASLLEMDHKPFGTDITEEAYPSDPVTHTTYLLKRLEVMEKWGMPKLSALSEAFGRFERKVKALTEESFTEPF